ncbi:hypothetical protein N7452_007394 [Penicillium brevicompactum]|uniref:Uncharacterized protein n=1 Tax=Penicillium brevicompactum TaxID=5074 RepID=A0A9W9UDX8_PENBR|nr:hypothetical protein N7452_007394 [Penicillium brevicompactum]
MRFNAASILTFLAGVAPVLGASVPNDLDQFTQKTDAIVKEFEGLEEVKLATQGTKALESTISLSDLKAEKFEDWPDQPLSKTEQDSSCKKLGMNLGTQFARKNKPFRTLKINRDAGGVLAKDRDITTVRIQSPLLLLSSTNENQEISQRLLNILPDCQQDVNTMMAALEASYLSVINLLAKHTDQGDYIQFTG